MKQAGLTVGGFYKHFGSRDDLVEQALGSAVGPWKGLVDAAASGGPPVTYALLLCYSPHSPIPLESALLQLLIVHDLKGDYSLYTMQVRCHNETP